MKNSGTGAYGERAADESSKRNLKSCSGVLLLIAVSLCSVAAYPQNHVWTTIAARHDDLTGKDTVAYSLASEHGDGRTPSVLTFFCSKGKLTDRTRITVEGTIYDRFQNPFIGLVTNVGVRLDSKRFPTRQFLVTDDFRSIDMPNSWLKDILKHKEFVLSFEVDPGITTAAVFEITHEGLNSVEASCGKLP